MLYYKKTQKAKDFEGARELQRYKFGLQYKQCKVKFKRMRFPHFQKIL